MSSYGDHKDEELIKLLKDNNEIAFTELYHRYHKSVYGYLLMQVKMPQHAQELLYEIFIKIWEIRSTLELTSSFAAYLFRVCHNKAVDFSRKKATDRRFRKELMSRYRELTDHPATSQNELRRIDRLVEEALGALTPQRRAVFERCRKQGKSYQQAAIELGISPNTVKEHMAKALASLRGFMQEKAGLAVIFCFMERFL